MACVICGSQNNSKPVVEFFEPDKYELAMGINKSRRKWVRCGNCGIYRQYRNYRIELLEPIYKDIYRSKEFRGESIEEAFNRIMALPVNESENEERVRWLKDALPITEGTMLDIGSGIGVFPSAMSDEWDVTCVEENRHSILFLNAINLPCVEQVTDERFDLVTLVHVLEHIEDLKGFLGKAIRHSNEFLFVEVPDAEEFEMLGKNNDEFNSCHEWFFTFPTLTRLLEDCGCHILDATRKYYPERGRSRLLVLAQCN
jgi:hypothetical protein